VLGHLLHLVLANCEAGAQVLLHGELREYLAPLRDVADAIGPNELLFRLSETTAGNDEQLLQQTLALTSREADVLLWLSRGKSNREMGEILTISPRTVNKHLEQIFVKLGVGNRASAAARAVRILAR
jgi:DNA-binding CsgD family transcriptional regulator